MTVRALAVPPAARLEVRAAAERLEVTERRVADQHHVAAAAAVAAVGAAARHVRLTAEGDDAVAPTAGLDEYARAIVQHAASLGA
jgi:hypothetical protein